MKMFLDDLRTMREDIRDAARDSWPFVVAGILVWGAVVGIPYLILTHQIAKFLK